MKKKIVICLMLLFLLASAVAAEPNNPLIGRWKAIRMITDGQDMDLTGVFKDFITATVVFDRSNAFSLTVTMFGNQTKTDGYYVIVEMGKLTLYANGNLSSGVYSFEGDTLILEESISGKATVLYLEKVESFYEIGDSIAFGTYEQDNDTTNGKEPIEWIVLDKCYDSSLVLMSKYALDCKPYNMESTDVTWETCTLRKWLNEDFYNAAFSAEEQTKIVPVMLENEDNPSNGTTGGNPTQDRVWLLSINEVTNQITTEKVYNCFTDDVSRMCAPTKYAVAQGAYQDSDYTIDSVGSCWWWLRCPGYYSTRAAFIYIDGNVLNHGTRVSHAGGSIRPVVVVLP